MRSRHGFTMIELLAVLTIMGVLVTIATPRYANARDRAIVASMTEDLKSLVTAQESFYTNNDDYAGSFSAGSERAAKGGDGQVNLSPSQGNDLTLTYHAGSTGAGWSATITNPSLTGRGITTCGIFIGPDSDSPSANVTQPGVPTCY